MKTTPVRALLPGSGVGGLPPRRPGRCGSTTYHTGNASEERFSLDRLVLEPLAWPGTPARAVDDTNLGKYFFEVRRPRHEPRPLLARVRVHLRRVGDDRRGEERFRTLHGVAAFPRARPRRSRSSVKKRDPQNAFREVWTLLVDPEGHLRRRRRRPARPGPLIAIETARPPGARRSTSCSSATATRRPSAAKFEKDARRLVEILFAASPFKERRSDFNVWALCPAGAGVGHLASLDRDPPPVARRRDLRRVRLGAVRPDVREPRPSATSPPSRPTSSSRS